MWMMFEQLRSYPQGGGICCFYPRSGTRRPGLHTHPCTETKCLKKKRKMQFSTEQCGTYLLPLI